MLCSKPESPVQMKSKSASAGSSKNQKETNMSTNPKEIHLIASLIAVPGKESELREVLHGLIEPTRKEPGCHRYEMYESEQKGRYFADEIWQNREALDTHMQSAHFKIAAAALPELLQGALGIDILSEIAS
jgi:quinol monooxygenase YgiN